MSVLQEFLPVIAAVVAMIISLVSAGFLVRNGNFPATIEVLRKSIEVYKEAIVADEMQKKAARDQIDSLHEQVEALDTALASERERSRKLETLIATWTLEREQMKARIATLEAQVKGMQP